MQHQQEDIGSDLNKIQKVRLDKFIFLKLAWSEFLKWTGWSAWKILKTSRMTIKKQLWAYVIYQSMATKVFPEKSKKPSIILFSCRFAPK